MICIIDHVEIDLDYETKDRNDLYMAPISLFTHHFLCFYESNIALPEWKT